MQLINVSFHHHQYHSIQDPELPPPLDELFQVVGGNQHHFAFSEVQKEWRTDNESKQRILGRV